MDLLFSQIETWQNQHPWGSVLDAGTGRHSLKWLSGLPTQSWTAVTGDIKRAAALQSEFKKAMREGDKICHGNWLDERFLKNEVYDVVVADYLLGAIDGFAPYFQKELFGRLKRHVDKRIYVVGMEPLPVFTPDEKGQLIVEMTNLRDAHIRLAGHRCYREYPLHWVKSSLVDAGYAVLHCATFPIRYTQKTINSQLSVCQQKLPFIHHQGLRDALRDEIESLRERITSLLLKKGPIVFGFDYVVCAEPKQS